MDVLYFFLGVAVTILMVAAPFLVMIAVVAAIGLGLIALILGIRTAHHNYAAL
jgi:hypothetical protein